MTEEVLEAQFWAEINKQKNYQMVLDRSDGVDEVTGALPDYRKYGQDGEKHIHHILGRNKPQGWKGFPEPLKSAWPHVPPGMIYLTESGHWWVGRASRYAKVLLLWFMRAKYGDLEWAGKSYKDWYELSPFAEYLR